MIEELRCPDLQGGVLEAELDDLPVKAEIILSN